MGFLEKNVDKKEKNKNVVVTGRVPEDVYDKFVKICDATGYTVSEAIRALVTNEVNPKKNVAPQTTKPRAETRNPQIQETLPETVSVQSETESVPLPQARSFNPSVNRMNSIGKFTTNRWKYNNMLPCPICGEWASASNFSRHAKVNHNTSTKEIFTTYAEEADKMVESVKAQEIK